MLRKYKQQLIEYQVVFPATRRLKLQYWIEQNNPGDVNKFHQALWLYGLLNVQTTSD